MGTQARSGGEVKQPEPDGDLWDHLSDSELAERLRQRHCPEPDIAWLVRGRGKWPANMAVNEWLRA